MTSGILFSSLLAALSPLAPQTLAKSRLCAREVTPVTEIGAVTGYGVGLWDQPPPPTLPVGWGQPTKAA